MEEAGATGSGRDRFRKVRIALGFGALLLLVGVVKTWHDTVADPLVRQARFTVAQLPPGTPPMRLVLLSDIHVAGPEMPPSRLARIVHDVNSFKPDLVLIAGDFVGDKGTATRHFSARNAIAPLGKLRPTLATVAVPGNHDHWRDMGTIRRELQRQNVVVLANEARRFGPLTIGGLDDDFTGHADLPATLRAMADLGGAPILLSHSPDPFPAVPGSVGLMLAGHTHCGQLQYPWGGAPATMSRYGGRYACGLVRENGKTLIVSSGLGTSLLPFRFGARPDVWLIELRAREK